MTKRKSTKYSIFSISFLITLFLANSCLACMWMESPETYRIAMFSVITPRMVSYSPFFYSADRFNDMIVDPEHNDKYKNCNEWINELDSKIKIQDVYVVLYNTNPDLLIEAARNKTLLKKFEKNLFIDALTRAENRIYLDYLLFTKQIEHWDFLLSDSWGESPDLKVIDPVVLGKDLVVLGEQKLRLETKHFLKQRYAFQLVRLYQRSNMDAKCVQTADKYFTNFSTSILGVWAQLHKAISLGRMGNSKQANYFLSIVFAQSDEKKLRSMQLFPTDELAVNETLNLAKSSIEKANIKAMSILQNPGETLNIMRSVYLLDQKNEMLPLLIMREVNKLEDWIGTSKYTYNVPLPRTGSDYYMHEDSVKAVNLKHDKTYLKRFVAFLDSIKKDNSPVLNPYISIAQAHLSFLDDNSKDAILYLSEIKSNAPTSVLTQKFVDEIMEAACKMKLSDPKFQELLAEKLLILENKEQKSRVLYKTLYSLSRYMAAQFSQNSDKALAGLFILKSNQYKEFSQDGRENYDAYSNTNYYTQLAYYDMYAKFEDVDRLIAMLKNPSNKLEKYLCKSISVDKFIELNGTIAFRNNQLETSYSYFKQLPNDFWSKNYSFKNYLNEDPFIPKIFTTQKARKFNYQFNKANFVGKLIELKKVAESNSPKRGEAYLEMAKAFFNCTYFGNAWMMCQYSWSSMYENYSIPDQDFGNGAMSEELKLNYYQCAIASQYYKKALQTSKNSETKAEATLMLHRCDFNKFLFQRSLNERYSTYDDQDKTETKYVPVFLKEFSLYQKTKFYSEINSNCMEVKNFILNME